MNLIEARSKRFDVQAASMPVPPAVPPLRRTPLAPPRAPPPRGIARRPWERALFWRRTALTLLVLAPSAVMAWLFAGALPPPRGDILTLALAAAFGLLFAWVAVWFWTATAGFLTLMFGRVLTRERTTDVDEEAGTNAARVAVVMPAYREDPALLAGAIASLYRGLEAKQALERYDFFILSDTADPDAWIAEEAAWARLVRELGGGGRIFYRRRRSRTKHKPGNLADFCRRWGRNYGYMIVLDADSILDANTAIELVARMDANPATGIIQTFPQVVNQETLYGRLQQFATALYGRMFTAGLHFWQLGAGIYWGHNAIVRLAPFMQHCLLRRIPGGPLGGDILSHDFVEAALMRRAGYDVWTAFDLGGSYEETPQCFSEDVRRDRRWARGNLQHLRLLGLHGLHGTHRVMFVAGAFSYVSSGIWLLFLILGTAAMVQHAWVAPNYFPQAHSPFPHWPVWHREVQIALIASAFGVLLLPKVFAWFLAASKRLTRRQLGGGPRLLGGVLLELLFSGLFAPARMLLHSFFVITTLFGARVKWGGPRKPAGAGWRQVLLRHSLGLILGLLWLVLALEVSITLFFWLLPVLAGLFLAPILEVFTGEPSLGLRLKNKGILVTGEERTPGPTLASRQATVESFRARPAPGFTAVLYDADIHRIHVALLRPHRLPRGSVGYGRLASASRLLRYGTRALDEGERMRLLYDRESLELLYRRLARSQPCNQHQQRNPDARE